MLKKTNRKKEDKFDYEDWFNASSSLCRVLHSDYISMKLLHYCEPLELAFPILQKALEVTEKSLKLFVSIKERSVITTSNLEGFGHWLENLRKKSSSHDKIFDDADIRSLTKYCDDKGMLYQFSRFGLQKNIDGMEGDLLKIIPVVDKIFCNSLILLPENCQKLFIITSPIERLLQGSQFYQGCNRELLLMSVKKNNVYFEKLNQCINKLSEEHELPSAGRGL